MSVGVAILLLAALVATRPWQAPDEAWFRVSALSGALLVGGLLIAIA